MAKVEKPGTTTANVSRSLLSAMRLDGDGTQLLSPSSNRLNCIDYLCTWLESSQLLSVVNQQQWDKSGPERITVMESQS